MENSKVIHRIRSDLIQEGVRLNFVLDGLKIRPMEILEKIFGSKDKVKIMRLFLFNTEKVFDLDDVAKRSNSIKRHANKELHNLFKAGLIKKKVFIKITESGNRVKRNGWVLNRSFHFLKALRNFLINKETISDKEIIRKLSKIGQVKLIIVAGTFIQNEEVRVDLFVVADRVNEATLSRAIRSLEAELGNDIKYASFNSEEFKYRLGMCDKLVRDVFDYPHKVVLDKIGIKQ